MQLFDGREVDVVTEISLQDEKTGVSRNYLIIKFPSAKYVLPEVVSKYAIIPSHYLKRG